VTATDPLEDARLLAAALRWWEAAGVDTLVEADPQPWLGRAPAPQVSAISAVSGSIPAASVAASPPTQQALPETLAALQLWLAQDPMIPEAGPPDRRLPAFGQAGSKIIIVTDMPENGDVEAGHLLSGPVGALFDAMLKAIGLGRNDVYCLPLCPGRTPTGRLAETALPRLGDIARHHIALAGADIVWALGQATSRALIGVDTTMSLDKFGQNINHITGKVPCIASLHPRLLLQAPQRKSLVWKDMQMLIGEVN
jgi:uracil-DNA glycosylase family 4